MRSGRLGGLGVMLDFRKVEVRRCGMTSERRVGEKWHRISRSSVRPPGLEQDP